MKKVMESIKEDARKRKITNKEIAKFLGISSGQVTHYFNLTNKIPFSKFTELCRYIYEEETKIEPHLISYVEKISKKEYIREAVEWFSNNGKRMLLEKVLELKGEEDPLLRIYSLLLLRNKREIKAQDFYIRLDALRDKSLDYPEWKALIRIATLYAFWDLKSFSMIPFIAEEALKQAEMITNQYLQKSYQTRVLEVKAIVEMKRNNLEESEKFAMEVIRNENDNPLSANSMYSLLSEMYVFRNYERSVEYISKALAQFSALELTGYSNRQGMLEATHDFIKIYHGKTDFLFLTDPSEEAHFLARKGTDKDKKRALEILSKIENENHRLSSHQLYYKALCTGKKEDMDNALNQFIINGDLFYSYLARETTDV
ncbi:AimR family lysis-lysogeny pheromone receptor [Mesobacillus thioparans]|uniref:AimR family lysis-lysogeny pheromone receptor n=1 Tax=Mesobacillus thioparans TaxID=370439 RepID=UPI0039EEB592